MSPSVSNALVANHPVEPVTDILKPVEDAIEQVLKHYGPDTAVKDVAAQERDTLGAAQYLQRRLQSFRKTSNCPNCWLPKSHCVCSKCTPISYKPAKLNRIFLLMHYKELMMKVDTSKLLWACYPAETVLVVSGMGSKFQPAMAEMESAIASKRCLVLFPTDTARTFSDIEQEMTCSKVDGVDIIVIDGTWQQARRVHNRYIASEEDGGPIQVKLSEDAVAILGRETADGEVNTGHQLRKHSTTWRQVATFEAARLFLRDLAQRDGVDMSWNDEMDKYQQIANQAVAGFKHGKRKRDL